MNTIYYEHNINGTEVCMSTLIRNLMHLTTMGLRENFPQLPDQNIIQVFNTTRCFL